MTVNHKFFCIHGFAEELDEIVYEGVSNWVISFRSLFTVYAAHFSYFVVFFSTIICGLLSYRHSVENGKKYIHFWWGAFLHGLVSERGLTARKYWHAQAPVMFFGKQIPLHILFFYPSVIYVTMVAVHKMKLNLFTEPPAIALIVMIMEIPYRMISVKFLHITYHDSDPMYNHKFCGVPWVEIFCSLIFTSSYIAVYHGIKYLQYQDASKIWDSSSVHRREFLTTLLIGFLGPAVGFLQKILLFHFLNDFFNVNPISCLFFVTSVYWSFVVCFEFKKLQNVVTETTSKTFLFYQVIIYLSCLLFLAMFGKPQNEISIGRHEPTGDCTTLICSRTPLGKPLKRKKYLCADEVAARKFFVYNFDCLEEGPPCLQAVWYTICGSPIYNKPQFFLNVLTFAILLFTIFYKTLLRNSSHLEATKRLMLRLRGSLRRPRPEPRNDSNASSEEGTTVGYVLIKSFPQEPFKNLMKFNAKFK